MRRHWSGSILIVMALAAFATVRGDDPAAPMDLRVGQKVANFTLPATDGSTFTLYGFAGKKAAVLVFTGTQCPVGNLYLPRLADIAREYEAKGIAFAAINSNASESLLDAQNHSREYALPFPMLKDAGNVVADALGVARTCEVLVIDGPGARPLPRGDRRPVRPRRSQARADRGLPSRRPRRRYRRSLAERRLDPRERLPDRAS